MDRTTVVAAVLLSAFIIDRLIASLFFLIDYVQRSDATDQGSRAKRSEATRKLKYFSLSAILSLVALHFINYSQIDLVGLQGVEKGAVLWLILVCGADRISEFIGGGSEPPAPAARKGEIHVTGTLQVAEGAQTPLDDAAMR